MTFEERRKIERARFLAGIRSVYYQSIGNPSVSGSVPADVRMRDAAGSDSHRKYKLSGPATQFGMPGRSTKVAKRG